MAHPATGGGEWGDDDDVGGFPGFLPRIKSRAGLEQLQVSEMARRSPTTVGIKVCLAKIGDEGSYLGMKEDGQLFLAPGGADLQETKCKYCRARGITLTYNYLYYCR